MHSMRRRKGRLVNYDRPVWEPLAELAGEHVGDFMWMHEEELEDGTRIHAYKHCETRRYLHLDHGGRAFVFKEDPPSGHPIARDTRWVFLGRDQSGVATEVIAVETSNESLMVIHAMELRARYRRTYEEVQRWAR
jgi:hypothetical protein